MCIDVQLVDYNKLRSPGPCRLPCKCLGDDVSKNDIKTALYIHYMLKSIRLYMLQGHL